jgi:hypothetical protein
LGTPAESAIEQPSASAASIDWNAATPAGRVHEPAAVVTRAADSADSKTFCGNSIDLAVTMERSQHFHAVLHFAADRRQQMLPVPKGKNNRQVGFTARIDVGELKRETRRHADESQVFGGGNANRRGDPPMSPDMSPKLHSGSHRRR